MLKEDTGHAHSVDAGDVPYGSLFKRIIVCHSAKGNKLFISIRAGEASRTLHQICTRLVLDAMLWFQEHLPLLSFTLSIIIHPVLCALDIQISVYLHLHSANQLTETIGRVAHCVRGQRSVMPWHEACTDWKPTPCRWPAAVLRLGFGCEVPIGHQFHLPSKQEPLPIG